MIAGQPVGERSSARSTAEEHLLSEVLGVARRHLGMEVAFVGRVAEGTRVFEVVDSSPDFRPFEVGDSDPLEESYCGRVLDGRVPSLLVDAQADRRVSDLPVTRELPIGTHLSVPIRAGGEVYGTLCCFSRTVVDDVSPRDLDVLKMFADIVGMHLQPVLDRARGTAGEKQRVRSLLDGGGPAVALQPIVELATDSVYGYEALARFREGGSPREWFLAAERVGLGPELEAAAVRNALELLPRLAPGTTLAVNVSATALMVSPEILAMFTPAVGERLVLEITEHERVPDPVSVRERLAAVRAAGVRVAVDDAGSGFAGLEHILMLGPEVLKLDRALVDGIAADTARQAMCEAMVSFCRRTDAMIVAEGVEEAADLVALRGLGVTHAQGYLLGRPRLCE